MKKVEIDDVLFNEMIIVNTFTKLIFDAETELDEMGLTLVELLCQSELPPACCSRREVSEYLRSMEVEEMISVVARLKKQFDQQFGALVATESVRASRPH